MTTTKGLLVLAISIPVILVAGSLYFVTQATQLNAAQTAPTISLPQGWVPFDADFFQIIPGGIHNASGRYYRAGDGSTRQETWTDDRTRGLVHIVNIPTRTSYVHTSDSEKWRVQPVVYPEGGYFPPGLHRLNNPGRRHLSERYEGLDVWEFRNKNGNFEISAPALNFFPVRVYVQATGKTFEFRNIQLRPQSAELFTQPSGVTDFERLDKPLVVREFLK